MKGIKAVFESFDGDRVRVKVVSQYKDTNGSHKFICISQGSQRYPKGFEIHTTDFWLFSDVKSVGAARYYRKDFNLSALPFVTKGE